MLSYFLSSTAFAVGSKPRNICSISLPDSVPSKRPSYLSHCVSIPDKEPRNNHLKFLLEHRSSKDMTDEQLAELASWSEKLRSIKNRMLIIVNCSNSQRARVILYLTALILGTYNSSSHDIVINLT